MVYADQQCLVRASCPRVREQDAPTAVSGNKNNYNARPLQSTTTSFCSHINSLIFLGQILVLALFLVVGESL